MNQKALIVAKDTASKMPWRWIIGAGLAVSAIYAGTRIWRDQQAKDQDRRATTNQSSPAELARLIYSYGAPSVWQWPKSLYTNTDKLLELATQITDFNAVRVSYEQIYRGRRLLDDLQDWLWADDYRLFMNIAQKKK